MAGCAGASLGCRANGVTVQESGNHNRTGAIIVRAIASMTWMRHAISPVDIEQRIPGVLLMEQPNGGMITRATFLSGLPTGVSGNAGQICAPEASRRPMMMRCTSEVPSTICMILLERKILATG